MCADCLCRQTADDKAPRMISSGMVQAIDDYRFKNRLPSRAEAIRRLIEMGLETAKSRAVSLRAVGPEDEDRAGPEAPQD